VVSVPSYLAKKPPTRVRSSAEQFFFGSCVADVKCTESRCGYSSAIKIKSSGQFIILSAILVIESCKQIVCDVQVNGKN